MDSVDVLSHFGSWTNAMRELKFGVNTYQHWVKVGYIPMPAQIKNRKT